VDGPLVSAVKGRKRKGGGGVRTNYGPEKKEPSKEPLILGRRKGEKTNVGALEVAQGKEEGCRC